VKIESAPLEDVEEYLRSCGGLWEKLPNSLSLSIKNLRPEEQNQGSMTEEFKQVRLRSYDYVVREFARACQRQNG
jgi:hypothetical protein